jgi:NADPH-dependent 7-cyano-7-deazaguanine reductase QueF-like protein
VNYGSHNVIELTVCETYTWNCNNETYTQSGTYICNYTNADGCASADTLILTVNYGTHNVVNVTACDSYTWNCNNTNYTQSGIYTCAYTNADGCPSVDTLNLIVNYGSHNVTDTTVCESYTWSCNNTTYTQSGTYTCAYTNADGCPSVDTLNLTVNYGTHNVIDTTVNVPFYWACNGQTYTVSGTYTCAYTNANGCASVDTLILDVNCGTFNVTDTTACESFTWDCNNTTYTQSGTYICKWMCFC